MILIEWLKLAKEDVQYGSFNSAIKKINYVISMLEEEKHDNPQANHKST